MTSDDAENLPFEPYTAVFDLDKPIAFEIRKQLSEPFLTVLATVIDTHAWAELRK